MAADADGSERGARRLVKAPASLDRSRRRPEPGVYVALPDLVRLEHSAHGFTFRPRQPVHSVLTGRHASRLRGRGLDFDEMRHYRPGDDVRAIDWKASVRTGRPFVRVYTEERDRSVLLLVDQRASMFFGSRRALKSVVAAEAAALAAWRVLAQGDRVGALVFNEEGTAEVRPHRSRASVMRILGDVQRKNHELGLAGAVPSRPGLLNDVLRRAGQVADHDTLICMITDLSGMDDETKRRLVLLSRHNDVIIVFVHDELEVRMPEAGRLVFGGPDGQIEVDTSDSNLRRRYSELFDREAGAFRDEMLRRAVPIIPLRTDAPVPEQVRQAIGRAAEGRGTPR